MAIQPEAQNREGNPQKRKADCLDTETGIRVPQANVVPDSILQKVPECLLDELRSLRSIFSGRSITLTSENSFEPVLLFIDPHRLPGKAHFGVVAKQNLARGELIAEETSYQEYCLVPLGETEDHFKMMVRLNHSCAPNVIVQFVLAKGEHGPEATAIQYLASRDISAGEELCKEYFEVCQPFEERERLSPFVCSCPVCNLPHQERCISDERRDQIAHTAQLDADSIETAEEAYHVLCKIKDARQLMSMEKIGEGCVMLKLSRLEMKLVHRSKSFDATEYTKLEVLLGKSVASWEESVQEGNKLSEECSSSGATMLLDSQGSSCHGLEDQEGSQEEEEEEEEEEEQQEDDDVQLSMHMSKVTRNLDKRMKTAAGAVELEEALADLVEVEDQCKRVGLCANALEMLDEVMLASEEAESTDFSSFSCEVDVDATLADDHDAEVHRRMRADVLACMGNYFAVFRFHDLATRQYTAALALDETNCSAKLGLEKVVRETQMQHLPDR